MQGIPLLILSFALVYACRKLLSLWKAVRTIQFVPGYLTFDVQTSRENDWLFPPSLVTLYRRSEGFQTDKMPYSMPNTTISLWPNARTMIVFADATAIALFVIGAAGFGRNISWKEDAVIPPGHSMTFKDALHVVTIEIFLKLIIPDWAMGLTKRFRRARLGFEELRTYMVEMIRDRQKAEKVERHDLFSSLLAANDHTLDASTLTESELIGNIYIFLVAGHETTAHTLCFTFALLALYPDEQEKLYQHIRSVIPEGRNPTYEEMPLLTYSMAVFYETLRMFPPVTGIPKEAAEDTSISVGNSSGKQTTVPIPKGADITISTVGLHYNPRYWNDPHSFKPARFLKDWPRDAFIPFSNGARACIGRKFFETEGLAILTMLVSRYKISIKEEPQFASETFEQRKTRVLAARAGLTVTHLPGYRVAFSQYSVVALLGRIRGLTPGGNHFFQDKHDGFKEWDMNSVVSIFPDPLITLTVADADAIKEITSSRARFPKPVFQYEILSFFGRNIVASEGEEWKKYRKISAPAFSDRNNKLVWDETVQIMNGLFNEVWKDKDVISLDHCVEITLPVGFGKRSSWNDDVNVPAGHRMTFKDSLHIASTDIFLKLFIPSWILRHGTTKMRNIEVAFEELDLHITEMIRERQTSEKVERYDLLSSLLEANNDDGEEVKLTESELRGNIFIYLLAGHETTAHTLCFAFALLAFHEEEQEILYQHIKSTLPDGRIPASHYRTCLQTYEDMPRLTYSMAVFYETLRVFPPVVNIPKVSAEDTVLTVGNIHGEKRTVPIAKGTRVAINTPGLHFNPRYWDDPTTFIPSRFLESDWNRDAFIPFSAGARACLGRKFFETEGIAVLTMLVSRYKISIKEEPQFAGETIDQCKERVFRTSNGLTLTPVRVPLTFTRRA
ncbi:hypothetical protein CVT25_013072 [Psilocybe cyanescens]|uniref:Cytochrome P450 n=1 Tax=Psilocybe cyanescens TaxID=93625 RepID=A0A409XSD5_PSICY|nr:hypothetical protein CVT25_013072 [Psilocybe cyanescens]